MLSSKNRELAALKQHGFLNEKTIDFFNAFYLGGGKPFQTDIATSFNYHASYSHKANGFFLRRNTHSSEFLFNIIIL